MLRNIIAVAVSVLVGIVLLFFAVVFLLLSAGFDNSNPSLSEILPGVIALIIAIAAASGLSWGISKNWKIVLLTVSIVVLISFPIFGLGF
ncbi:MAG: hypothetical protein WD187_04115 [Candidatus Woykebacteria bacterium]